jgi:hypothetical protein
MKRTSLVGSLLLLAFGPAAALRGSDSPPRVASAVRAVFSAKCARCHGPDVARPKGRFGYVLDLGRVAANPEMVVPGKPDESELWELIRRGEMPPEDSPSGPLTAEQKEAVRAWIAAGAPADTGQVSPPAEPTTDASNSGHFQHTLRRAGKFHLLFLHFPIALLLAAAAGEVWSAARGGRWVAAGVRFCVWCGAVSAVPTALLGWLFAAGGVGAGEPGLLGWHRWLGTGAAAWAVASALVVERDSRRGVRTATARLMVVIGAVLVASAAHFGGMLVHGQDFFDR